MNETNNREKSERREAIASRLRAAREAAGLSQGQVAREMKMHRPTVTEIEAGRRRVSVEELEQFAVLYGVGLAWLSCSEAGPVDPAEDRLQLAARELSRLKPEDLNRLLGLLQTMRQGDVGSGGDSPK
jgi:transcriptional regulator with XRE-family HTH domain